MARFPELGDEIHHKILTYITEPKASASCRFWKEYLYRTLHLSLRSRFLRCLGERGDVLFHYSAVRPLAEGLEEILNYNFSFSPDGTYRMQWTRVWDVLSSQSE